MRQHVRAKQGCRLSDNRPRSNLPIDRRGCLLDLIPPKPRLPGQRCGGWSKSRFAGLTRKRNESSRGRLRKRIAPYLAIRAFLIKSHKTFTIRYLQTILRTSKGSDVAIAASSHSSTQCGSYGSVQNGLRRKSDRSPRRDELGHIPFPNNLRWIRERKQGGGHGGATLRVPAASPNTMAQRNGVDQ